MKTAFYFQFPTTLYRRTQKGKGKREDISRLILHEALKSALAEKHIKFATTFLCDSSNPRKSRIFIVSAGRRRWIALQAWGLEKDSRYIDFNQLKKSEDLNKNLA